MSIFCYFGNKLNRKAEVLLRVAVLYCVLVEYTILYIIHTKIEVMHARR